MFQRQCLHKNGITSSNVNFSSVLNWRGKLVNKSNITQQENNRSVLQFMKLVLSVNQKKKSHQRLQLSEIFLSWINEGLKCTTRIHTWSGVGTRSIHSGHGRVNTDTGNDPRLTNLHWKVHTSKSWGPLWLTYLDDFLACMFFSLKGGVHGGLTNTGVRVQGERRGCYCQWTLPKRLVCVNSTY